MLSSVCSVTVAAMLRSSLPAPDCSALGSFAPKVTSAAAAAALAQRDRITTAQKQLAKIGCFPGTVTGQMNNETQAAITRYLTQKGRDAGNSDLTDDLAAERVDEPAALRLLPTVGQESVPVVVDLVLTLHAHIERERVRVRMSRSRVHPLHLLPEDLELGDEPGAVGTLLQRPGVHVAEQGMVGAMALATKDVRPYHVYVGIPAKSVRVKPNAPDASMILRTTGERKAP